MASNAAPHLIDTLSKLEGTLVRKYSNKFGISLT